MLTIDSILEILNNGYWHTVTEVAKKAGTQRSKVELISSFLAGYDFLEFDKKAQRIKLSSQMRIFLKKIGKIEREEAVERKRSAVISLLLL